MFDEPLIVTYETISDLTWQMLRAAQRDDWAMFVGVEAFRAQLTESLATRSAAEHMSEVEKQRKREILYQVMYDNLDINDLVSKRELQRELQARAIAIDETTTTDFRKAA